ncbi:MAG: metallophosphoesterase [Pseudomonadales bacterium]|nr:metallophosphoesterase [Pseudomonadales bacterium]
MRSFSFLFFCLLVQFAHGESEWSGVERIVAVGDVHGDFDSFVAVLREAELINRRRNWVGGTTHLVQVGDLPDRGPDTDRIIELMQKLERQAMEDGGMVHALIGNHEAMNMLGDLRYVHPGEYAALRGRNARQLRDNYYGLHVEQMQANDPEFVADSAYRDSFDERYPLGYVEHRIAWGPEGEIGSWILQHNAVIKINRTLFLHGGIGPELVGTDLETINDTIRSELAGNLGEEQGLSEVDYGPLWYRGLAQNPVYAEMAHVDALLAAYDVDRIVIGHTPGAGTIVPRFDSKVLLIDTGMSAYYGGYMASLEITEVGGETRLNARQLEQRIRLPVSDIDTVEYLRQMQSRLQQPPAGLQRRIDALQNPPSPPAEASN